MLIMGTPTVKEDEAGVRRHHPAHLYIQHLPGVETSTKDSSSEVGVACDLQGDSLTCQVQKSLGFLLKRNPVGETTQHLCVPTQGRGGQQARVLPCTAPRSGAFTPIHLSLTLAFSLGSSPPKTKSPTPQTPGGQPA